ncbi:MAG: hypothetical protein Q7J98_07595, partial [Kiritimatiellia bacterium]|nr:hypothetical protein [Kiritimatiellia bacterium]
FDLAAVRTISLLSEANFIPLHQDIQEFAPFRFFAPAGQSTSKLFLQSLASWPAAVLSFLKIHPTVLTSDPIEARWKIASRLASCFEHGFVFFGLGYCELLLIAGGDNLKQLLWTVTECRKPAGHKALTDLPQELKIDPTASLFLKTTTFPLTSYEHIHSGLRYDRLKGSLYPVVTISCDPACEALIFSLLRETKEVKVRTVYGKTDLILCWDDEIPISRFAQFLTNLRTSAATAGLMAKTTSYLEIERVESATCKVSDIIAPHQRRSGAEEIKMGSLTHVQPPALKASLTDLMLRLISCVSNGDSVDTYRDMRNTIEYVMDIVDKVIVPPDVSELKKMKARFVLARVADLARSAINQRYAGLESHPETLAHAHSPITCDIATVVAAATCVPHYVFGRLRLGVSAEQTWPGYVVFGTDYSPHWSLQDILALPADSLYSPIKEWWKITHEVGHAVFRLLNVRERIAEYSPALHQAMVADINLSGESPEHVINELFANWFDWRYIFVKDTACYMGFIWASWLNYPLIWTSPRQYIYRSFAVFLCDDLDAWTAAWSGGRKDRSLWPYLETRWNHFCSMLQPISKWADFLKAAGANIKDEVFTVMDYVQPLMCFFASRLEGHCGVEGISERLNPPYPGLSGDIESLAYGKVIQQQIENPCRLNLELLRRYSEGDIPLATEVAYVLSLANTYRLNSKTTNK